MILAYNDNKRLARRNLNLECLIRIRAVATVSNPVGADVVRIEAPQMGRSEDGMVSVALRIRIDRHALSCITRVGERISVVTEGMRITNGRARVTVRRTSLRHTAVY